MPERNMLSRLRRSPTTLKADLSAGLTTALVAIPDGLASAMLAGLSPIHGLYALMIGTPIAALLEKKLPAVAPLMLAGVSPPLHAQLVKTGTVEICGSERVFIAEADVLAAPRRALQVATDSR